MVENARDIGGKPQSYKEGRAWAKTICQESVKAQDMQIKQAMKGPERQTVTEGYGRGFGPSPLRECPRCTGAHLNGTRYETDLNSH
jgi:hypothetical protein